MPQNRAVGSTLEEGFWGIEFPFIYVKTITLPEFCRTLISFLGSVLTILGSRTHHSPWASVSQLILLKFCQFWCIFSQKWGPYFILLVLWINFSVISHQFGCIPKAQRTQNEFRKSNPVFFGLFVVIFFKLLKNIGFLLWRSVSSKKGLI